MTQPRMRVGAVTIGAPNPRALAAFYARLLGWTVAQEYGPRPGDPLESGWAQLVPPRPDAGPRLNFEFEQGYVPPVWPSVAGEQQIMEHLDIGVEDLEAAVAWALAAGAKLAEYQPQEQVRVMLDPAGHPFCLFPAADPFTD